MQDKNEEMVDKIFTMCRDFGNSGGKLDKTNFPHIRLQRFLALAQNHTNIHMYNYLDCRMDKYRQGRKVYFCVTL